jgi:hypothetical protein
MGTGPSGPWEKNIGTEFATGPGQRLTNFKRGFELRVMIAKLILAFMVFLSFGSGAVVMAASGGDQDSDNSFAQAKILEVTDGHISILSSNGVEHVVGVDSDKTTVLLDEKRVGISDLRVGDSVSVDIDVRNPVLFAKTIKLDSSESQTLVAGLARK